MPILKCYATTHLKSKEEVGAEEKGHLPGMHLANARPANA
jgi:hypothetical protein